MFCTLIINQHRAQRNGLTVSAFAFGLLSMSAQAALALPKSGVYDQVDTVTGPHLSIKTSSHLTFKGNKFRLESTSPQDYLPYIDIVDGQSFYHFVPVAKEALRNELPKTYLSTLDVLQHQTQDILQHATKTGETPVGDINCDTYTLTLPNGAKATYYLDKDTSFPFVIKQVVTDSNTLVTETTSFENIKLDVPVAESMFTLPTGTKIDQAPPPPADNSSSGASASGSATPPAPSAPGG